MADATFAGKLLVANPRLSDPNFDRTVVQVLVHSEDGAIGVVLNRPSDTAVAEPLPQWSSAASAPSVVFVGGPVGSDSVLCLARVPVPARLQAQAGGGDVWRPVGADLGTLDLDVDPDVTLGAVTSLRIFAGYAGWGSGQLESEIAAGGWWVLGGFPEDPFTAAPIDLWHDVLRRQGGHLSLVAAYPPDPELH